jgi:signal transduction histidine kinase
MTPHIETVSQPSHRHLDEAQALRTLNAFAVDIMSIPTAEDLFWYVAQNVVGRLKFIDCVIYQADSNTRKLTQVAALGEKNPFGRNILNPLVIPFGEGITGRVAQTQKPIIINDLLTDSGYIPDTEPARSEICVPLVSRGKIVGVIDSEHPEVGAFGDAELEILTTIAAMTSAKLELIEEAERSNQRYKDLLNSHAQLTQETHNRKDLEAKLFEARKLEAIGRLSGKFAHEFNNLLTVIYGNLEFIGMSLRDPNDLVFLSDAQSSVTRGAQMIGDMLAFSQRAQLKIETFDLNSIAAVSRDAAQEGAVKPFELQLDLGDDLWPVSADLKVTKLALLSLIENGKDAILDNGMLCITTENIWHNGSEEQLILTQLPHGRYVCLSVEDNGVGISGDRLPQIFDPFYTTKTVGEGCGMGLSSVMGFMKQIGGAIGVTSKVHRGSTFSLYFPAAANNDNGLLTMKR